MIALCLVVKSSCDVLLTELATIGVWNALRVPILATHSHALREFVAIAESVRLE